jgi:hypothetical protein
MRIEWNAKRLRRVGLHALMQDTREVDTVWAHCKSRYRGLRPCAMGFSKKLGPNVTGINPQNLDRYSDEEIKQAYDKIQAWRTVYAVCFDCRRR